MTKRYDDVIAEIAAYACRPEPVGTTEAYETARLCLMDSIGCALLALAHPACREFLGVDEECNVSTGNVPIIGTNRQSSAPDVAFAITSAIRWLDFNDTWLAREWGHPSDNFGAILAASYETTVNLAASRDYRIRDVLDLAIRAYEIHGVIALDNAFNRVGIDHVLLVKVASAAVVAAVLTDFDEERVASTVSHAWLEATLRTYRHAPNTGARKSWAAGDATSRAVNLAQFAKRGMQGCHTALTAPTYGFQEAWFRGETMTLQRPFGCYVMENVLFKVRYPAEFHGQTAVEAAVALHPQVAHRLDEIAKITIKTQEPAKRIIDKSGPLHNEADRDHCIQYMTAVALINGDLQSHDYEDDAARDRRIDELRAKMVVDEVPEYTSEYLNPDLRSIANAVQVRFADGSETEEVEIRFPIGHRQRRNEAIPMLHEKFQNNVQSSVRNRRSAERIIDLFGDAATLDSMRITDFMQALVMRH